MIDIVFSGVVGGQLDTIMSGNKRIIAELKNELKQTDSRIRFKSIEKSEDIIILEFYWDIGYLNQAEDSEYRMKIPASLYYGHHVRLHPEDEADLLEEGEGNLLALNKIRKYANEGKSFRIWYSHSATELSGFYHICHLLKDYSVEIHVVELPTIYHIGRQAKHVTGWSMVETYELGYLIKNQRIFANEEVCLISSRWEKLVVENAPLRAVIANKLISVPANFYDALFLSYMNEDEISENNWIEQIMDLSLGLSCGFVEQRIWTMGEEGILQLLQDGENMRDRVWKKL